MLDEGPLEVLLECSMMIEEDDPEETCEEDPPDEDDGTEEFAEDEWLLPCELTEEPCDELLELAED